MPNETVWKWAGIMLIITFFCFCVSILSLPFEMKAGVYQQVNTTMKGMFAYVQRKEEANEKSINNITDRMKKLEKEVKDMGYLVEGQCPPGRI